MNFSRGFTQVEYFFLISFGLIYLFYFYRVFYAAYKLKTTATTSVFKFLVRSVYIGLMFVALLGPNFGVTVKEARASGKDIYFVLDLSESMNANDVEPTRLDRSKNEMLNLMDRFAADRIGLIAFNSDAHMLAPLTFDHKNIKNMLLSIKTSSIPKGSTDLTQVFELLNQKTNQSSKNRGKVAVILTDGEIHEPINQGLINELKKNNVYLYYFGVGTLNGGKIPTSQGFKKDKYGNEVITKLDINKLNDLAKASDSEYFILNNEKNELQSLSQKMMQVVSSTADLNKQTVTYNKFVFFLLLALIFVGIDFLITIKVLKI